MMPAISALRSLLLLLASTMGTSLVARDEKAFFESRIRPVLAQHCLECHSQEAGKAKGGLRLDDREAVIRGGDSGPAVIPGKPEESLLLLAMQHRDPDLTMPPRKARLPDQVLADFASWIEAGAHDPRETAAAGGVGEGFEVRRRHWSFQPLTPPNRPEVKRQDWALSEIDSFVLAKLEENGLEPSPDAEAVAFLRRLSFDLVGLPPTPEQVDSFSWDRLEETVDRLLSSPAFGERWARHWLDVARYSESNGKEANLIYPHAWRYRDYVIDAFQRDLPFDRFLMEQLAGDLLPADGPAEKARHLIATGFLAFGPKGLAEQNPEQFVADVVDEQIDAFSRSMLGMSLACARCHDHKSDPVSMDDYYALAGIFRSTDTRYGTWVDSENNQGGRLIRLPELPGQLIPNRSLTKEALAKLKQDLAQLDADEKAAEERAEKAAAEGRDPQMDFNEALREALRIYWSRGPLVGKLETVDEEGRALPLCMGVLEADEVVDSPRFERGEIAHPGQVVPRAVPALFGLATEGPVPRETSGRLQLAKWVADPENPLPARVMANRVWTRLFGAGLVETVDDFGRTGATPSHPELLDHLAWRFREGGWSVKSLVREIVLSRSYRQASAWRAEAFEKDPDNRLLWRFPKRRLDAEAMRDAMLAVSGELDLSPRQGSLVAELEIQSASMIPFNQKIPRDLDGSLHRSVYLPVMRDQLPEVLALFDFAEPSLVMGRRDSTNVPPQALFLMNSEFVRARSLALGRRIAQEAATLSERIEAAYQRCLNRLPDEDERRLVEAFLASPAPEGADPAEEAEKRLADFCQALLASADFRILD